MARRGLGPARCGYQGTVKALLIPVLVVVLSLAALWGTRVWSVRREKDPVKRAALRRALYHHRDADGQRLSSRGTTNTTGY